MVKISNCIRKSILDIPTYVPGVPATVRVRAKLNSNENPLGPSERVLRAIAETIPNVNRYPIAPQSLLVKIADYVSLAAENVLLGNGSDELVDAVVKTFVDAGESVVVCPPTFEMYEIYTRLIGGRVKAVPLRRDFSWDVDGILKAISRGTKVVFICSPNNPTGNIISEEDLLRIAEKEVIVVVDEAYVEFAGKSFVPLLRKQKNLIVLRTFSKAFGLAGLRVGYALADSEVVGYIRCVRPPFPVNILALRAAEVAVEDRERLEQVKALVAAGKRYLYSELGKIKGAKAYPSEANFILVGVAKTGFTSTEIVEALFKQGILVRDGVRFKGLGKGYMRVTVGMMGENEAFIQALKNLLAGGR